MRTEPGLQAVWHSLFASARGAGHRWTVLSRYITASLLWARQHRCLPAANPKATKRRQAPVMHEQIVNSARVQSLFRAGVDYLEYILFDCAKSPSIRPKSR